MELLIYFTFLADRLIAVCITISLTLVLLIILMYVRADAMGDEAPKKCITRMAIGLIVAIFLSVFTPSTKQIATMYFLPKLLGNQDDVIDTSTKLYKVFDKYLGDTINEKE